MSHDKKYQNDECQKQKNVKTNGYSSPRSTGMAFAWIASSVDMIDFCRDGVLLLPRPEVGAENQSLKSVNR